MAPLLKNEQDVQLFERLAFMTAERRLGAERMALFHRFFTDLRAAKIPVSTREYLTLLEALRKARSSRRLTASMR
jgi:hypothetical protein